MKHIQQKIIRDMMERAKVKLRQARLMKELEPTWRNVRGQSIDDIIAQCTQQLAEGHAQLS